MLPRSSSAPVLRILVPFKCYHPIILRVVGFVVRRLNLELSRTERISPLKLPLPDGGVAETVPCTQQQSEKKKRICTEKNIDILYPKNVCEYYNRPREDAMITQTFEVASFVAAAVAALLFHHYQIICSLFMFNWRQIDSLLVLLAALVKSSGLSSNEIANRIITANGFYRPCHRRRHRRCARGKETDEKWQKQ